MIDVNGTLTLIILFCSAAGGLAMVVTGLYTITAKPKLDRIEAHLIRLNGSVATAVAKAAEHETAHIRQDSEWRV